MKKIIIITILALNLAGQLSATELQLPTQEFCNKYCQPCTGPICPDVVLQECMLCR